MAKHSITHTCGHTVEHNVLGTNVNGERDRKIAWLGEQPCLACARQERVADAAALTADLIPLTGSEKQVTWATKIRATARATIDAFAAGKPASPRAEAALAALYAQAAASWWIDRRDNVTAQQWLVAGEAAA